MSETQDPYSGFGGESEPVEAEEGLILVHVRPDTDPKVQELYQEGVKLLAYANSLELTGDSEVTTAGEDLSVVKGVSKALETLRKAWVAPLNGHVKEINDFFKTYKAPLDSADGTMQKKILAYRAEQERRRLAQEEINRKRDETAREEMALNGELSEPVGLIKVDTVAPKAYRTGTTTMSTPKAWKFEVEDFAKLSDDFKEANLVKIRKHVIAGVEIKGVRVWQEESLSVTPRRY